MRDFHKILLFFLILLSSKSIMAQNLYDETNSRKYANYLFVAGEFKLASEEYERLNFMLPGNDTFQTRLIQSYRKISSYDLADLRLSKFYPNQDFIIKETAIEYLIVQFKKNNFEQSKLFIDSTVILNEDERLFFKVSVDLFSYNYDNALVEINSFKNELPTQLLDYSDILTDYSEIRFKKQIVAAGLSTLFPGLGQTYSGYWKDGIFALLFTASSAYQSYRGFDKGGIKSPYGWIYGALATGFYLGNIYGAAKSANKYNFIKKEEIDKRVEKVFTTYYP